MGMKMTDSLFDRTRSRTRPREGVVACTLGEKAFSSADQNLKCGKGLACPVSVESGSHQTETTEQSCTMSEDWGSKSLTHDIPLEVVIIADDEEIIPSIKGHIVRDDVERRLKNFETVILTYKDKLKSSEHLNSSLHKYLRQTQGYAENLLSERQELIDIIKEMENEDSRRIDQELLLKFMMSSSLALYLLGGSHQLLAGTVVLQLLYTFISVLF
mmetsp:Transcript_14016/g.32593  ORF Transcript_14016/g.32593 Transcript_14016/m.32593 type:complete len:215 (+) Transcript_14016:185-829(+)